MEFDLAAYIFAISSVFAQAIYLTYVQKTGVESGVSALSVLHLNSINCIPFLFAYSTLSGNLVKAFYFQGNSDPQFVVSYISFDTCLDFIVYSILLITVSGPLQQ